MTALSCWSCGFFGHTKSICLTGATWMGLMLEGSEGLPRGMENFGGALEAFSKASSFCWSVSWIDIDGESAGSSGGLLD